MSAVSAKERARSHSSCQDFNCSFSAVIKVLLKCNSPKQILNTEESGVTARPFKRTRRKVVSLITCPVELHFQDIRDVSHASVVGTVSLGLNSLLLLFLTVPTIDSRDLEMCTMPGDLQPSM
jgi:hypothetical protein